MSNDLVRYIQQQIRTENDRLHRHTHTADGKQRPRRFMYVKVEKYLKEFLALRNQHPIVVIPGLRGVGKTTLMAQLYSAYRSRFSHVLFLSVDRSINLFNAGIDDLMQAYEQILGVDLEALDRPVAVFLDEVQSDPNWSVTLKTLYDRTNKVFFCCTGSSALMLQTSTDLARRAIFEKLPPLCFTEYQMITHGIYPPKLKTPIRNALYFSPTAEDAYNQLKRLEPAVNQYWAKIDRHDVSRYLTYGTLPFTETMPDEAAIYDSLSMLLSKIITEDLPLLGSFNTDTLAAVNRLLFILAEADVTSLNSLEEQLGINRLTLSHVLDAMEKAELLIKVPAYGSNMTVAKKPAKYLFMSPALRMSFYYFTGQEGTFLTRQGKLLEDTVGAHLYREFIMRGHGAFRYDSAEGGADFILQIQNSRQLIIEVGMGQKNSRQIRKSKERVQSDYNLIFSKTELSLNREHQIVMVPLDYYFLL